MCRVVNQILPFVTQTCFFFIGDRFRGEVGDLHERVISSGHDWRKLVAYDSRFDQASCKKKQPTIPRYPGEYLLR